MSTVACPNGHQSTDPDWCDTCGAKIGGSPPSPQPPSHATTSPALTSAPVHCPHCTELNPADALFCEVCGYDFTTGQAPPAPVVTT